MKKILLHSASLCALFASVTALAREEQIHAYFIGNSLTMSLTLDRVHELFDQRDTDLQFGSQISAGKSLIQHFQYQENDNAKWNCWETSILDNGSYEPHTNHWRAEDHRFGRWDRALAEFKWDKLILQLHGSSLHDDLIAIPGFIDYALEHGSIQDVYLYSAWPARPTERRNRQNPRNLDYAKEWTDDYVASPDDNSRDARRNYSTRDYLNTIYNSLEEHYAGSGVNLRVIPVGEVLFAIDQQIRNDELPGIADLAKREPKAVPGLDTDTDTSHGVNILYADHIHFNPIPHKSGTLGIFISGTTAYTVLSGQNPVGLSAEVYGLDDVQDRELIRSIQETIWNVVSADPRTGIQSGE